MSLTTRQIHKYIFLYLDTSDFKNQYFLFEHSPNSLHHKYDGLAILFSYFTRMIVWST